MGVDELRDDDLLGLSVTAMVVPKREWREEAVRLLVSLSLFSASRSWDRELWARWIVFVLSM